MAQCTSTGDSPSPRSPSTIRATRDDVVAGQHRLAELEDVVARDVEHRGAHIVEAELAGRMEQRQLLHFLMRGEQVAFDPVDEERQRLRIGTLGLARRGARRSTPAASREIDQRRVDRDAGRVERVEPGRVLLLAFETRQA